MCDAQFGRAKYYTDVSPTIAARTDRDGAVVLIEYEEGMKESNKSDLWKISETINDISQKMEAEEYKNDISGEPKVVQLGNLVHNEGYKDPHRGRVYSPEGLSPTLNCMGGGNLEPKIIEVTQMSSSQNSRVIDPEGISYAVTNGHKGGMPNIIEPQVLCPVRNEYGKAVRKAYEQGLMYAKRSERTDMVPRTDGVSNTITTVQKDNYLAEPLRVQQATAKGYVEVPPGSIFDGTYPNSKTRRGRVQDGGKLSPTITSSGEPLNVYEGKTEVSYRIRKLTPRECFRLQGVSDKDIDTIIGAGISKTQCYKLAGNSITVDVLFHIFRKMFVDTDAVRAPIQLNLFNE